FTVQGVLLDVEYSGGEELDKPRAGNLYATVYFSITNLGPGMARDQDTLDFKVLDSSGVLQSSELTPESSDCRIRNVDLIPGGTINACVGFQVPQGGVLHLVYTPLAIDPLEEGHSVQWLLRP
ncbi:MAG: DUF4352 domain-containing protein, partial [Candidatus Marsarchaeota archaeon]|nr:DUF4352 domain-containing protein [Candidatus Marsarchaeota archaeon]